MVATASTEHSYWLSACFCCVKISRNLRFLRFSFTQRTQRTQRKRLHLNGNRALLTGWLINDLSRISYPRRLCRSAWVERSSPSVRVFVCLSVVKLKNEWPQSLHVWCREWPWDILEVTLFWDWKVKGQGHRVSKCIFHTNIRSITQKTNYLKVFKLDVENDLGILFWGWKVKGQG